MEFYVETFVNILIVSTHRTISTILEKRWTMEQSDYQVVKLHTHATMVDFVGRLNQFN